MISQEDETREIIEEYKAALAKLEKLEELKRQWYEADTQIRVKLNWVIETQEKIEGEILDIILGVKE
jgi:hypothetical protein